METKEKIKKLIDDNDVCLFMKGTPDSPQCGVSMAVSNLLKHLKQNRVCKHVVIYMFRLRFKNTQFAPPNSVHVIQNAQIPLEY